MKIISITQKLKQIWIGLLFLVLMIECKDPDLVVTTSDAVNITGYFEQNPQEFSEFLKMLELTGNAGFLNAYGSYTCFAPTNDAVVKFLEVKGFSSIEAINIDDLKKIVALHMLNDTLSTKTFTDGKINRLTMHGQYLTTGAINENGSTYIRVNRQANITKGNILVQNGIIHAINGVLEPASYTVAQLIEQNPDYSIFTEALKGTGFYDSLNALYVDGSPTDRKWSTLIAQSDEVFAGMGINSYDDLKAKYSNKGNPKDPEDSLYLFVGYHILRDAKYIADLVTMSSHSTAIPLEIVTAKLEGESVVINENVFNGVVEKGAHLDRTNSDFTATNGVFHSSLQNFAIKLRKPIPIYWDVAEQPELIKKSLFRTIAGGNFDIQKGELKDVTWDNLNTAGVKNPISYWSGPRNGNVGGDGWVNYDFLAFNLTSSRTSNGTTKYINWIEFKTPVIIKGKYKIWFCMNDLSFNHFQFSFDDVPFPRVMLGFTGSNTKILWPTVNNVKLSEPEAEAQGFKRFTTIISSGNRVYFGRLIGTIEVKTTDRHRLKIVPTTNDLQNGTNLDMIHFIPVENEQTWPRFNKDGSRKEKP